MKLAGAGMAIICKLARHSRSDRVWHDGMDFRSTCRRCGQAMIKDELARGWRVFDPVADTHPARLMTTHESA